jgi:hypothetical protein
MNPGRKRLIIGFFIAAVVFWIVGAVAGPIILQNTTLQARTDNAILGGISFILIFIGVILAYMGSIAWLAAVLNNRIPATIYTPILNLLIAGIVLGVVGMFQPFLFVLYQIGFGMLLFSTIGYIAWGHISPRSVRRQEVIGSGPSQK